MGRPNGTAAALLLNCEHIGSRGLLHSRMLDTLQMRGGGFEEGQMVTRQFP